MIGAGPNGLAAAITLAQAGRSVLVREANATVGGSCRSAELTLPGFVHDICSTVQALALASPFMRSLPLAEHGLELVHPKAAYAQPLDDGTAGVAYPSLDETASTLGRDGAAWKKLFGPLVRDWQKLVPELLGPFSPFPRHPFAMANFGLKALRSARSLAHGWFEGEHAKGLFAGVAAHSIVPLERMATSAFGLVLGASAHAGGWPVARGGSQKLADALASILRSLGGEIELQARVETLDELPPAKAVLCDVTARQLLKLAGPRLPQGYQKRLQAFRYGPGVHKVDWALSEPIPWKASGCRDAGTIHLGGTFDELAEAERAPWEGRYAEKPYVLLVQYPFEPSRAPAGKQIAWAYCHVPNGGELDVTDRIERQIERFAPGFKDTILARSAMGPAAMERHNANLIGGDITGGANLFSQVFARPTLRVNPYKTPVKGLYLCSSSTPPGGGVHGMSGYHAARTALRDVLR
ncbi:NAD(P)/FAD-dependent oxidoreductase [Hyalangium sp.]|uniref:phytoene desaturase family protein n=1 Tax=Hyalangium sp. TaxID=2028555 RepID=UPI002D2D7D15|nr:NAD(P)/FAD-dependent oxidoreductase [Hyalangium sp.]HYH96395.1 NAD(P)/FAD-dependent oxidoreductase [Hyalangium sp.]